MWHFPWSVANGPHTTRFKKNTPPWHFFSSFKNASNGHLECMALGLYFIWEKWQRALWSKAMFAVVALLKMMGIWSLLFGQASFKARHNILVYTFRTPKQVA